MKGAQKRCRVSSSEDEGGIKWRETDLKPHDQGDRQVELFGCVDNALCNHVALHNPAKNVDENGFDLGITWMKGEVV